MLKKLIGFVFVLLVPMQAMAALAMDLQMQAKPALASAAVGAQTSSHHPCHPEAGATMDAASDEAATANQGSCQSCPLCMAFGLSFDSFILVTDDHLTQSVPQFTQTLVSADLSSPSKPPIL
jgi:hypothetical protein